MLGQNKGAKSYFKTLKIKPNFGKIFHKTCLVLKKKHPKISFNSRPEMGP